MFGKQAFKLNAWFRNAALLFFFSLHLKKKKGARLQNNINNMKMYFTKMLYCF